MLLKGAEPLSSRVIMTAMMASTSPRYHSPHNLCAVVNMT
jgi:hypothetical protein